MIRRSTVRSGKWSRLVRQTRAALLAVVLTSLPASAVDHADSRQASTPNDPFAVYEAQLSDAASNTLDYVVQPAPGTTMTHAFSKMEEVPVPAPQPGGQNALRRVEQLRPVIEPILHEVGVPTELAAVVLVESGGQPTALSSKGARGIWQLMPDTARRYGLIVNSTRDDRTDPEKSTHAAARYLRHLYAQFGNWSLALAAYDAGELLIESAMIGTGTTDFAGLSTTGRIPSETRSYVPAVWAAVERLANSSRPANRMTSKTAEVVYALAEIQN